MGTFMSVEFSATAPSTRRPEAPRPTAFPLSRKFASSPARQTESSSPAFSSSVVSMPPSPPPRTACGFRSRLLPVPGRLWNRTAARPPVLPAPSSSAPQVARGSLSVFPSADSPPSGALAPPSGTMASAAAFRSRKTPPPTNPPTASPSMSSASSSPPGPGVLPAPPTARRSTPSPVSPPSAIPMPARSHGRSKPKPASPTNTVPPLTPAPSPTAPASPETMPCFHRAENETPAWNRLAIG